MPARSKAQQRLMAAAEHGAQFPMAQKVRASMTHGQMHDFAIGPMKGKPAHAPKPHRSSGPSLAQHEQRFGNPLARHAPAMPSALPHPHRNLKGYLHPKKAR